ncbi:nucleoside kinase [Lachnospiraceae bacterium 62-35]
MITVTVNGEKKTYENGTTLLQAAGEYQSMYKEDILLASVDGKLRELWKKMKDKTSITFLTGMDKPGRQTYERTAVFLMLKAFHDVIGRENIERIVIEFSIGNGLYGEASGKFVLDEKLIAKVKARMEELAAQKMPIHKKSINTDDAVALFKKYGMVGKEKLFSYRRASRVNIYSLDGYEDYFYGYMAPDTGYIKRFDLIPCHKGFVLILPSRESFSKMEEYVHKDKLFTILKESDEWGEKMGIACVGQLNEEISMGRSRDIILIQEALQEKKIAEIAARIVAQPDKKFVMIAGPSSSGKTTFSRKLSIQLKAQGLRPHAISVDDYFVDREKSPKDENGNYNFEALECIDLEQLNQDMTDLLAGKTVEIPRFDFKKGKREYKGDFLTMGKSDILVMEGIHCLNDKLSYSLPKENKFKIYISALNQLNIDDHNRIATTDGRLLRRIVRDARTRGNSARDTIKMWGSVRKGEESNIFPYQEEADVMFNSALVYEAAVLKIYAEPLLFQIPKDAEEYVEAKRLLKFLDYFLGMDSSLVPMDSLVREFIGGSCYQV